MSDRQAVEALRRNIQSVYHGRREVVDSCLVALLARGHLLLEDVPGVGKTTLASVLSQSIDCSFRRIQFTSDLLPSDILGVTIYNQEQRRFEFKPGPLFANVVLADEVNRTTPKTQSALLEAMNSAQVSIDGETHPIGRPFMVLATQNPLDYHGTFPLPRGQMDRFLMRVHLGYPDRREEIRILREQKLAMEDLQVKPVVHRDDVVRMQEAVAAVHVEEDLLDYMVRLAEVTRTSSGFELGCSTRGLLALRRAAQAHAWMQGRDYLVPDDVQAVAVAVLAHRVQVATSFDRDGATGREDVDAVRRVLDSVAVPL